METPILELFLFFFIKIILLHKSPDLAYPYMTLFENFEQLQKKDEI